MWLERLRQPSVSLQEEPAKPVSSPTGVVFTGPQKAGLLLLVLGMLYYRLWKRKRAHDHICSHCGKRNPSHRVNCEQCSAPLFKA
ncbi:MAG: zinc finger protein [Holophagaceae bacterium]